MPDSANGLYILILTLPGFIGYAVFNFVSHRKIKQTIDSVGFIVLINCISLALNAYGFNRLSTPLTIGLEGKQLVLNIEFVATFLRLAMLSGTLGFVLACVGNVQKIETALFKFGIGRKTGSNSLIADVICLNPDVYFRIWFKSGEYVVGHPIRYSLDGDENAIFLEKALHRPAVVSEAVGWNRKSVLRTPKERTIDGPGVLIISYDDIRWIEVL